MFDPGTSWRPFIGGWIGDSEEEEEEKEPKFCKRCEKEVDRYDHFKYSGYCEQCYRIELWDSIHVGSRIKLKHSEESDVPKKICGLWVTIVQINNRSNPQFLCPRTNMLRTLKFCNMDEVREKWIKR
jgi:hypothetical protein